MGSMMKSNIEKETEIVLLFRGKPHECNRITVTSLPLLKNVMKPQT